MNTETRYEIHELVAGGGAYDVHYSSVDKAEATGMYERLRASGETAIRLVQVEAIVLREATPAEASADGYLEIPTFLRRQSD